MENNKKDKRETLVLDGNDAEFFLQQVQKGKFSIRLGHILKVPRVKGTSILLPDYDDCSDIDRKEIIRRLSACGLTGIQILKTVRSPSGKGWHCVIRINGKFCPFAIIALQCIIESDPNREAQNFKRAQIMKGEEWQKTGNVLFTN